MFCLPIRDKGRIDRLVKFACRIVADIEQVIFGGLCGTAQNQGSRKHCGQYSAHSWENSSAKHGNAQSEIWVRMANAERFCPAFKVGSSGAAFVVSSAGA